MLTDKQLTDLTLAELSQLSISDITALSKGLLTSKGDLTNDQFASLCSDKINEYEQIAAQFESQVLDEVSSITDGISDLTDGVTDNLGQLNNMADHFINKTFVITDELIAKYGDITLPNLNNPFGSFIEVDNLGVPSISLDAVLSTCIGYVDGKAIWASLWPELHFEENLGETIATPRLVLLLSGITYSTPAGMTEAITDSRVSGPCFAITNKGVDGTMLLEGIFDDDRSDVISIFSSKANISAGEELYPNLSLIDDPTYGTMDAILGDVVYREEIYAALNDIKTASNCYGSLAAEQIQQILDQYIDNPYVQQFRSLLNGSKEYSAGSVRSLIAAWMSGYSSESNGLEFVRLGTLDNFNNILSTAFTWVIDISVTVVAAVVSIFTYGVGTLLVPLWNGIKSLWNTVNQVEEFSVINENIGASPIPTLNKEAAFHIFDRAWNTFQHDFPVEASALLSSGYLSIVRNPVPTDGTGTFWFTEDGYPDSFWDDSLVYLMSASDVVADENNATGASNASLGVAAIYTLDRWEEFQTLPQAPSDHSFDILSHRFCLTDCSPDTIDYGNGQVGPANPVEWGWVNCVHDGEGVSNPRFHMSWCSQEKQGVALGAWASTFLEPEYILQMQDGQLRRTLIKNVWMRMVEQTYSNWDLYAGEEGSPSISVDSDLFLNEKIPAIGQYLTVYMPYREFFMSEDDQISLWCTTVSEGGRPPFRALTQDFVRDYNWLYSDNNDLNIVTLEWIATYYALAKVYGDKFLDSISSPITFTANGPSGGLSRIPSYWLDWMNTKCKTLRDTFVVSLIATRLYASERMWSIARNWLGHVPTIPSNPGNIRWNPLDILISDLGSSFSWIASWDTFLNPSENHWLYQEFVDETVVPGQQKLNLDTTFRIVGQTPFHLFSVKYPEVSRTALITGAVLMGAAAVTAAATAFVVKRGVKKRRAAKFLKREKAYNSAKTAYMSKPTSDNLRNYLKAGKKYERAKSKALLSGVPGILGNPVSNATGSSNTNLFSTLTEAIASETPKESLPTVETNVLYETLTGKDYSIVDNLTPEI